MDVQAMDDDIRNELDRDACAVSNVHIDSTSIYGLEAVHDQLLLQRDDHVALEDDPQRLVLDDSVAQGARPRVDRVVVASVCDHIVAAVAATNGIATEANPAVREALAVPLPVGVAAPAVVDGVASSA